MTTQFFQAASHRALRASILLCSQRRSARRCRPAAAAQRGVPPKVSAGCAAALRASTLAAADAALHKRAGGRCWLLGRALSACLRCPRGGARRRPAHGTRAACGSQRRAHSRGGRGWRAAAPADGGAAAQAARGAAAAAHAADDVAAGPGAERGGHAAALEEGVRPLCGVAAGEGWGMPACLRAEPGAPCGARQTA